MQVTLLDAYAEACRIIEEQCVTQRLLDRAEHELDDQQDKDSGMSA